MAAFKKPGRQFASTKRRPSRKRSVLLFSGIIIGIFFAGTLYQASVYFSTNESCMICHVHPQAEESWRLSTHVNNGSGVMVDCVDCHLPPKNNTWKHYAAKANLGMRDVWGYLTKDSADFRWEQKSELEYAVGYIPNESCVKCHQNLFPQGVTDEGITAHLYYEENEKKLNLQCISCHLDAGHYNPNYSHAKMTGIPGLTGSGASPPDTSLFYKEATEVDSFASYTEKIPGTATTINMIAIPGGTFRMGSPGKEPLRSPDEGPVHEVRISPFFMAEVETTWDQYWTFYRQTMSEGRTPPDVVYENNLKAMNVDGISGPTPPFGFPDQGWGGGSRPAITMTHYAAEVFCQWLSQKTGKKYRLPTEAEWEYAARGNRETPYYFAGSPNDFSNDGFWRRFFKAKTDSIGSYVIYVNNSDNRTQEPGAVLANPFGLKNMLGNVMEYCSDKYDAGAYSKRSSGAENPVATQGEEWVVRGGSYASDAARTRSAARDHTHHEAWLKTDPQQPKSIWWYSDVKGIGFRVVCDPGTNIE